MSQSASIPGPARAAAVLDTRDRILDAAEIAFARRGLEGTRVREIAGGAGVTPAALYLYFDGKRELYRAVIDRGFQPIADLLEAFDPAAGDPAVEQIVGGVLRHLRARPQLAGIVYHEAISRGELLPHLARTWLRPLFERIGVLIRRGGTSEVWEDHEVPQVVAALLQVVLGHFSLAPLLAEVLDRDPLAPEVLDEQLRFLLKLLGQIFGVEDPAAHAD